PVASLTEPAMQSSPLNALLEHVLQCVEDDADVLATLYGPVFCDTDPVHVYTDGSCLLPGTSRARAGAGVYWGRNADRNTAARVPGLQTSSRGELYAVLVALSMADPLRSL
ncbi:hypothetical protein OBBRIDRAFT_706906, partial [Obba rivulosa]